MSVLWQDGDWSIAAVDGAKRWFNPIEDSTAGKVAFEQDYMQSESSWTPVALGTRHPSLAGFFLTKESQLTPLGGGKVKWTRTYAKIPDARTRYESYGWLVPGIGSEAVYADVSISSFSFSGLVETIVTATSSTASLGDTVSVAYTFTDTITGTQYGRRCLRGCLTGTSGTTVKVSPITEPGGTVTLQTLRKVEPGRAPETLEVQSQLQIDYWLPGVSVGVTTPLDIPVISALEIYDEDGRKTNTFNETTDPTVVWWRSNVAYRAPVCVVASVSRVWMGPIYERTTRYCIPQ
jgi:hypothetical protein